MENTDLRARMLERSMRGKTAEEIFENVAAALWVMPTGAAEVGLAEDCEAVLTAEG
jgi:hypothetical protein